MGHALGEPKALLGASPSRPQAEEDCEASVLLVDDHPENLLALEVVLKDLCPRLNLVMAGSGQEALKRMLERDFAVILLDVQMPDLDGFETASLIRQRERSRHTPIIFLTAINTNELYAFKGYSFGAVDYLFKPIPQDVLRAKVSVFVDLFKKSEILRRQSQRLAEINQELSRSNSELEQFAYVASHDLREPLRKVCGFVDLLALRLKGRLDSESEEYVRFVVDGVTRMESLISNLLEYSRVGRGEKRLENVDTGALLQKVLSDLEPLIEESGAKIHRDAMPELRADPLQMRQLFQNLVGNALKFRGKRALKLDIGARRQGDSWAFFVKDNGIGIDRAHHQRIFSIFQRLHRRDEYPGTGIGLAICKKVVENHGGRIWVESEPGRGSTFYFTLPAS